MRFDVGSIPLMCILSVFTSNVFGYLPNEDLTNALPGSIQASGGYPEGIIPGEGIDEEGRSQEEDADPESESIYRKKPTFRRRNINGYGGRTPFGRMAYKSGYGSNRFNPRNVGNGGFYERERNPYGTVNMGGSFKPYPEEYNVRPSPPYSGLIGGSRSGYYGSTAGMRRPMGKSKGPADFQPDYPSNDLMGSFNHAGGALPSLRELATYASRYGPAYLRERFGAAESTNERPQMYRGLQIPNIPREGGGGAGDFSYNIASNKWNGPVGIMSRDVDSYQHDDSNNSAKKQRSTTTTTTTAGPKRKAKPAKDKPRNAKSKKAATDKSKGNKEETKQ